ncbi:MAG: hypothetical protein AAF184_17515 [Pseudomonadota bacterium]
MRYNANRALGLRFYGALIGVLGVSVAVAQQSDTFVACDVLDPEFDSDNDVLVYQREISIVEQRAFAAFMDPATGTIVPNTTSQIADDVEYYNRAQAGPKFAVGTSPQLQPETFLAYTRRIGTLADNTQAVGILTYDDGVLGCFPGVGPAGDCFDPSAVGQIPAVEDVVPGSMESRFFVYTNEDEGSPFRATALYAYDTDPNDLFSDELRWATVTDWLPNGTGGERQFNQQGVVWGRLHTYQGAIDDSLKVVTTYRSPTPSIQVWLVDVENPDTVAPINVTGQTASNKFNPYLFVNADPAENNNMVAFRESAPNALSSAITIRAETAPGSGIWEDFMQITASDLTSLYEDELVFQSEAVANLNFLLSPETFNFGGRTYVLFSTSSALQFPQATDGNVWLALVERSPNPVRAIRLNTRSPGRARRIRAELEVYEGGNGVPYFFYSEVVGPNDPDGCTFNQNLLQDFALRRVTVSLAVLNSL